MQMDKTKQKIAFSFLVAIFLAAFEGVVVSTAAPVLVKSLHDFEMLSWIFSIFLLTSAISTPIYGKLADLYGRKRIFIIGISIFLIGSLFAGLSQTMTQLIIFRGIQGIGAGAILTIGFTMIGDIFTVEERSIIQGAVSSIWGVAGLIGPLLGGFLIDYLSWHWIFLINIPFGLICIYILVKFVHEQKPTIKPKIDYIGAILLSIAIGTFLYGIMQLNEDVHLAINLFIITFISAILFYLQEAKISEPIVPLFILNKDSIIVNIVTFLSSFILIGCSVYLPLHIQSIMGYSATIAGISLVTTSISWFVSSIFTATLLKKYPTNFIIMVSSLILIFSSWLLTTLTIDTSLYYLSFYVFFFGFGFSGTLNTLTIIVQDSVKYNLRGAAIGLNMLTRLLAQTIGVTILGAYLNLATDTYISSYNLINITMQNFYDNTTPQYNDILRHALFYGLNHIYYVLIGIGIICFFFSYFIPKHHSHNS